MIEKEFLQLKNGHDHPSGKNGQNLAAGYFPRLPKAPRRKQRDPRKETFVNIRFPVVVSMNPVIQDKAENAGRW